MGCASSQSLGHQSLDHDRDGKYRRCAGLPSNWEKSHTGGRHIGPVTKTRRYDILQVHTARTPRMRGGRQLFIPA